MLSDVFLWRVQWASAVWIFGMVHLERISTGNTHLSKKQTGMHARETAPRWQAGRRNGEELHSNEELTVEDPTGWKKENKNRNEVTHSQSICMLFMMVSIRYSLWCYIQVCTQVLQTQSLSYLTCAAMIVSCTFKHERIYCKNNKNNYYRQDTYTYTLEVQNKRWSKSSYLHNNSKSGSNDDTLTGHFIRPVHLKYKCLISQPHGSNQQI